MQSRASPVPRPPIVSHIASEDLLHFYRDGHPDYKRIAGLIKLSKADLSKIAQVAKSSVRFDGHIPEPVAERLREIANIANPMLGNISPSNMIRIGKQKRLLTFVVSAREENGATPK
jgi:hypothetical protein